MKEEDTIISQTKIDENDEQETVELHENVNIEDLDKFCRICLCQSEMTSLHRSKDYPTFVFLLQTCHKSGIPIDNIYPSNICGVCSSELQNISHFISKLKKTTEQLNALFDEDIEIVENEKVIENSNTGQLSNMFGKNIEIINDKTEKYSKSRNDANPNPKNFTLSTEDSFVEETIFIEDLQDESSDSVKNLKDSYRCDFCDRTFNYFTSWQCHMARHDEINKAKCQYCNWIGLDESKYEDHLKTNHGDELMNTEAENPIFYNKCENDDEKKPKKLASLTIEGKFKCNSCGVIFKEAANLKKHILIHTERNTLQCELCGNIFTDNAELELHLESFHDKKYDIDGVKIRKRKRQVHSMKKPGSTHTCILCDKRFVLKSSLNRHKLIVHEKNKRFCCEICGEKFTVKNSLKFHSYIHSDSKPYPCQLCSRAFRQPAALFRHQRTKHNQSKNFMCDICLKMFKTSKGLESHSIRHSNDLV